jgi:hypothetical protein
MSASEDFNIVGSFNNQRFTTIDVERSVNVFEYIDPLGKKPKSLINTSGLLNTNFTFVGATGGFRAQFTFSGDEYHVIGDRVYKISSIGAISFLGSLTTTTGYVGIDANTFQVIFVDGAKGYIWDETADTFVMITDTSFPAQPIDVTYLDGFFIVANGNTNNFQLSMFNQGLVWGPDFTTGTGNAFVATSGGSPNLVLSTGTTLNYQIGTPITFNGSGTLPIGTPPITKTDTYYVKSIVNATTFTISATDGGAAITFSTTGTAPIFVTNSGQLQQGSITTHPGTIVACRTLHRRLFLFSQFFTEVWENAGIGTNLPFRRNNSLLLEYGTPCLGSISVSFDIMCFLSQTRDGLGPVMQVNGSQAVSISNHALDAVYAQYDSLQQLGDCMAYLIKENGLIFYRMNFTAANHTFIYNVTLSDPQQEERKLWHEEEVLNGNRHPAQTLAYFNGKNYVGSYNSPTMYILDRATFTNDGEAIRRMRISRPVTPPGYQRTRIDRFQIDLLQGNIFELNNQSFEINLETENLFDITTEDGDDIITEQSLILASPLSPFVYLSISKDGGQTYGYIIKAPMGLVGQRSFRTLWRQLGVIPRGQGFVVKVEFYDPIPIIILGASWAFEILPE